MVRAWKPPSCLKQYLFQLILFFSPPPPPCCRVGAVESLLNVSDNHSGAFPPPSTQSQPALTVISSSGGSPQTEVVAARAERTSATLEHLSDELTPPPRQFLPAPLDCSFPASGRSSRPVFFSVSASAERAPVCPLFLFPLPTGSFQKRDGLSPRGRRRPQCS